MSWQLGAFAILALALGGGFLWYERVRPDARIVALVGTLAAFAALGRIAFAAFPNVKPTTDIVLVSGYALGGGPGFAVGALAGLASNFFFGQGPWTPWQMAGWGAVGVIGAGLAVLTGRRIGRWPLAVVCAVVGFAFTALQDVGDWVTYSDHSLAQLGVYVGKGVGFDFVHAAGCFAFALAFGPALIRSLSRFTLRLNVTWRTATPLLALALTAWLATQPGVLGEGRAAAANTPAGYLIAAQNSDGGIGRNARLVLLTALFGVGRARAGRRGRESARRHARRSQPDRLRRDRRGIVRSGRRRAGHPRRWRRRLAGHELRRAQPPRRAPGRHPPERVGEQPDELDVVRRARAAVCGRRAAGGQPRVARAPAGLGRRLQLRHPRRAERRRRHRGRARGARGRRRVGGRARPDPGGRLHSRPAGPRRRLPRHARRRLERPVDGVRSAGAARGRGRSELAPPQGSAVAARLSAFADRRRRSCPLRAGQRRDADVGDGRGADGARWQGAAGGGAGAPDHAGSIPDHDDHSDDLDRLHDSDDRRQRQSEGAAPGQGRARGPRSWRPGPLLRSFRRRTSVSSRATRGS